MSEDLQYWIRYPLGLYASSAVAENHNYAVYIVSSAIDIQISCYTL